MRNHIVTAALAAALGLAFAGCRSGASTEAPAGSAPRELELVYVEWDSEIASTHVIAEVLRQAGFEVELTPVGAAAMWQALAAGDADATVAAWLPTTHGHYLERFEGKLDDLGPNLTGTRIGLVVPGYVDVDSIADLRARPEAVGGRIVGIDPGAGIMSKTEAAVETYGLARLDLVSGSGATMTAALADAISREEPIVVTGWTPHWKFARWELKYLDDPEGVFGGDESIHTIARQGLRVEQPEAVAILDRFSWTPEDMAEVMVLAREKGARPEDAARKWLADHPERAAEWLGRQP